MYDECLAPIYMYRYDVRENPGDINLIKKNWFDNIYYAKPEGLSLNFKKAKEYAEKRGARLVTLKEARKFLKKTGALWPQTDSWTPCTDDNKDGYDWVQTGNKHWKPGMSFLEKWENNPDWGEKESEKAADNVEWRRGMLFYKQQEEEKVV